MCIVHSRFVSYSDTWRKCLHIGVGSALLVLWHRAMREPQSVGRVTESESYAFFCAVIVVRIGNMCNPIVLPTASVDNYFFCYSMKIEPRRGGILQAGV